MDKCRTLKFIVNGQIITQDPDCDFSNLVPGTEEYIVAEFSFSPEWKDMMKVATFHSIMGREHQPQLLGDGKTCKIPTAALKRRVFKVGVVGKGQNSKKLTTNKVAVRQDGGNA